MISFSNIVYLIIPKQQHVFGLPIYMYYGNLQLFFAIVTLNYILYFRESFANTLSKATVVFVVVNGRVKFLMRSLLGAAGPLENSYIFKYNFYWDNFRFTEKMQR